ncbi:MAG: hypothetical protein LBC40_03750 [Dysgonamonadaceae bacterium]|nr:hypothetical protein [Dysgonamonadaceae bacterium]
MKKMMKQNCFWLVALLFWAACDAPYELDLPLSTNQSLVELTKAQGETNVMVYSTGNWSAAFEYPVEWAELEKQNGSGNGMFKFKYTENTGSSRSVNVILRAGGLSKTVKFIQGKALTPELAFTANNPEIVCGAYPVTLPLKTNLQTSVDKSNISVYLQYSEESDEEWMKDYEITDDGFKFNVTENTSGNDRRVQIRLIHRDAYGAETIAECILKQTLANPSLTLPVNTADYMSDEAFYDVAYNTNMSYSASAIDATVAYTDGAGWIEEIVAGAKGFSFRLKDNDSGAMRKATINLALTSLNGSVIALATYEVVQMLMSYNKLSFEDLRGLISGATGEITILDPYTILTAHVVSENDNLNLEVNPNTSLTAIDWTENDKTAYLQSTDGKYGVRVKTPTIDDNVFRHSQEVTFSLKDVTLEKESNPERYTLKGVTAASIVSVSDATLAVKVKSIGELTDNDMYTCVTLSNVEFALKNGAYANVHDGYTWGGIGTTNISGSTAGRGVDCAPRMLIDANGNHLNMLLNMKLPWRRTGNGIPMGAGKVSGIIVHSKLIRYAVNGDIGRYQIRPLKEEDIALDRNENAGLTHTLAEWNWSANVNTPQAVWSPDVASAGNTGATLGHTSITTVAMRPDFNSTFVYYKNNTTAGSNNPTGQTSDIEGYYAFGAAEYRGVFWNYAQNRGEGFVANFSTMGVNSRMYLMFTIAGGGQADGAYNYFPTYWHVEYAADGINYQKISDSDFTVRPIGWWTTLPLFSIMALSEQCVTLPADAANKPGVSVKITPSSKTGLTSNTDETYGDVSPTIATYVRLGTVSIKYNK